MARLNAVDQKAKGCFERLIFGDEGDVGAKRIQEGCDVTAKLIGFEIAVFKAQRDRLFDGDWHHIAFSYNGIDQRLTLFIDGQQVATRFARGIPTSIQPTKPMRFFDATSDWDRDNRNHLLIENSAQFECNAIPRPDLANTRYIGLVDNIKVTAAAVPALKLGYYTDGFLESIREKKE